MYYILGKKGVDVDVKSPTDPVFWHSSGWLAASEEFPG